MDQSSQGSQRERLVRECETSGALAMFSAVVCNMNSRPPKDMKAFFTRFANEAKFTPVRRGVLFAYQERFGRISFVSALGVSMGHCKGRPLCFVKTSDLLKRPVQQEIIRRPQVGPIEHRFSGAYTPEGATVFQAAIIGQDWRRLSHGVPSGNLRR